MVSYKTIHDLTYGPPQYAGRSKKWFGIKRFMIKLMVVLNLLVGVKKGLVYKDS